MNVKHIIKSQSARHLILKWFAWLPDRMMLPLQYYAILHRTLHLKNPERFTEKIQWYKAYYRNPQMLICTDKYRVRAFVMDKLGDDRYLNHLYQVCNRAEEIDFESLPQRFVIKTTDGGNGDNVYICRDKTEIDRERVIKLVNSWRNKKYDSVSREWAYKGARQSRIIVERYLEDLQSTDGSIDDYKFLCFDGIFRYLWVDKNRYSNHRRGFWDESLQFLPDVKSDHPTFEVAPQLPTNIQEMIRVAEQLAADFPFARVDLYNIDGNIYFGEITFYPWSGYVQYTPDSFDYELGRHFPIKKVANDDLCSYVRL